MPNNKKKDGFIMQAGILAAAGIVVRIIGLLYNSPMTAILGDEGIGYYNTAYYAYTIVLLISSYSIPSAISKVIAQKLAVKEYRNAHRIFKCAMIYVLVVGGIASLFVFFGAGLLVQIDNAIPALKVLAPTIFLSGILGVLRGYFQAHRSMVQTSVSQIVEQILNAAFSILMAYLLMKAAVGMTESERLAYGAAGGAVGTGIGVLTALLFMTGVYALNRKMIKRRIKRDVGHQDESYFEVFKMILFVVTPFIMSTFIYNANTFINQTVYQGILTDVKGLSDVVVAAHTGIAGKAVKISNIPIALASAMATALIPGISSDFAQGYLEGARNKVAKSMKVTMLISIPAAVGIGVLSKPIMLVLYPQKESLDLSAMLLSVLAVSVVFYAISTLSNAVLQSIGKLNSPVINAALALVLQTAALAGMLYYWDEKFGPYYYVTAIILYSFLMCVLNGIAVKRHLSYHQEAVKTFLLPILASVIMGAVSFLTYQGLYMLLHMNIPALSAAVLVGVTVYFILVIRFDAVTEEEMRSMPKGYLLLKLAKKTGIMKKSKKEAGKKAAKATVKRKKTGKKSAVVKTTAEKSKAGKSAKAEWKTETAKQSEEDYWLDD